MDSQALLGSEELKKESEEDALISEAQKLMERITPSPENHNPTVLHALASMLEMLDLEKLTNAFLDFKDLYGSEQLQFSRMCSAFEMAPDF